MQSRIKIMQQTTATVEGHPHFRGAFPDVTPYSPEEEQLTFTCSKMRLYPPGYPPPLCLCVPS